MNKNKRFFAFGCSLTRYHYATWADYIGVNFEEYYNFGISGICNTSIANRVVESNYRFNFNSDTDYVVVSLTGIRRMSFFNSKLPSDTHTLGWLAKGDLFEYEKNNPNTFASDFIKYIYSTDWALYQSWISTKIITNVLRGIPHKIILGVGSDLSEMSHNKWMADEFLDTIDKNILRITNKNGLSGWAAEKYSPADFIKWKVGNKNKNFEFDDHPTQQMHYDFVKLAFPEFITLKTNEYFKNVQTIFNSSNIKMQKNNFETFQRTYRNVLPEPYFLTIPK